jgi:hypothetical protein
VVSLFDDTNATVDDIQGPDQQQCPHSAMGEDVIALSGQRRRSQPCGRVALLRNRATPTQGVIARLFCKSRRCPDCGPRRAERLYLTFLDLLGAWLDANPGFGRPVYGTPAFMRSSGAHEPEPITVGGRRRSISLRDPGVPDADMTWRQVLAALEAVRLDPAGAHERVQVAAAPPARSRCG